MRTSPACYRFFVVGGIQYGDFLFESMVANMDEIDAANVQGLHKFLEPLAMAVSQIEYIAEDSAGFLLWPCFRSRSSNPTKVNLEPESEQSNHNSLIGHLHHPGYHCQCRQP